jgi:hypothetical protein
MRVAIHCEVFQRAVRAAMAFLVIMPLALMPLKGFGRQKEASNPVAAGWHPWYEVKADAENPKNLIICGTAWDAEANAPFGFVYSSTDGGLTWRAALEDRSSTWVTEHSCAFGANHRAYFVSEASKVIDGKPHHGLGTTRLFVSLDGGLHWAETIKTGWADYSTSAVSSASGRLYTFFQSISWVDAPRGKRGNTVGLLLFSADGKSLAGPILNSNLRAFRYRGVYPSNALTLKSGAVVALYYGRRLTSAGWKADLGILHADTSARPSFNATVLSHPVMDWSKSCFHFADNSLSYDAARGQLFLVYVDGCSGAKQIKAMWSADEGRTWTKSVVLVSTGASGQELYNPSVVAVSNRRWALLWNEGKDRRFGRWLFSYVQDLETISPPIELSTGSKEFELSNDSLWTAVFPTRGPDSRSPTAESNSTMTLNVATELNTVWRASGLVAMGDKVLAIWLSGNSEGSRLSSRVLDPMGLLPNASGPGGAEPVHETDATTRTILLYGGSQRFDNASRTLTIQVSLANRGLTPLRIPIKLKVEEVDSSIGTVSILNATNGMTGTGAVWDISDSVTGDQIPPDTVSNPFCLVFRMSVPVGSAPPVYGDDLLVLRLKVIASVIPVS